MADSEALAVGSRTAFAARFLGRRFAYTLAGLDEPAVYGISCNPSRR